MPTASNMTGKAALVTGAASGLGRATALALGRAWAAVCIVDLNAAGLEETANQRQPQLSRRMHLDRSRHHRRVKARFT